MMVTKTTYKVMLSSTYTELAGHRRGVSDAMLSQQMFPVAMDNDAAIPDQDLIDASLAKVDEADAYVGLISYRYGQMPECSMRNPDQLSLTELEFHRAVDRNIPVCMFIMHGDHPVPRREYGEEDGTKQKKLEAFLRLAKRDRICAEFKSVDDLKAKAVQSLAKLREVLDKRESSNTGDAVGPTAASALPIPPAPYEKPKYIPSYNFVGREKELNLISDWATAADPVLVFEAIGGMGKSMLTWQWIQRHARTRRSDWGGILWYSFYERGADMNDFCVTALAYITSGRPKDFRGRKTADLAPELLRHLQARPWLLVLDGLERVLVAYHRHDAAQVRDDDVETDPDRAGRRPEACIRPADDELLQSITGASPSKILVSSRLTPQALLNRAGRPLPGVNHVWLRGLAPEDAERMVRDIGVRGSSALIQNYLKRQFGCHPLVVGVVAGLVYYFPPAPGDFDRWVDDPEGGYEVNLATLDLKQRQNHILSTAFADLEPQARELLARLALISEAVEWDVVEALNPKRPEPPEAAKEPKPVDDEWDFEMRKLRRELAAEKSEDERKTLLAALLLLRQTLDERYESAKEKFVAYQRSLEAWRQSAELRAARQWLTSMLLDLEKRGLVQRDQQTARLDLHPVVRGFAIDSLTAEAKDLFGKKVADYFSTRPDPPYEKAASLGDLSNGLQVVRALNLAGGHGAAYGALRSGFWSALDLLELYHEILALLRPIFPGSWDEPPAGIEDRGSAADRAGDALYRLGRYREAGAQHEFAIRYAIADGEFDILPDLLHSYTMDLNGAGQFAKAARVLALARLCSTATGHQGDIDKINRATIMNMLEHGAVDEARKLWDEALGQEAYDRADIDIRAVLIVAETHICRFEGRQFETELDSVIRTCDELRDRALVRLLHWARAKLRQRHGQHAAAVEAFEQAIAMARAADLRSVYTTAYEAEYGISLAHLGRREEALAAAARATAADDPPHSGLAELYLLLGDRAKAREHALAGYRKAWADGPPYSDYWALELIREVLRALGEPEPQLPPFDPVKLEPLSFEADLHAMLEKHEEKASKPRHQE